MTRAAVAATATALLLAGCSPHLAPLSADHPASPTAPAGRLAGRPAVLRPGVAADTLAPVAPPDAGATR